MIRSYLTRTTLGLAGLLALTGCPPAGGGGGDNNGDGGDVSQEDFFELVEDSYAKVLCRTVFECPESVNGVAFLGRFESQAVCEQGILELFPEPPFGNIRDGLDAGRIVFDGEAAAACKTDFEAKIASLDVCSSLDDLQIDSCEDVFVGQVAVGGNCLAGDDCEGGGSCSITGDACFGTCEARGTCGDDVCEDSEFCGFDDNGDDACKAKLDVGDACDFSDDCTASSEDVGCLTSSGASEGTCTAYRSVAAGGACGFNDQFCAEGLACNDDQVCEAAESIALGGAGDDCDFQEAPCMPGLVCTNISISQETGLSATCGAPKKAGEECYVLLECAIGLTCVGAELNSASPVAGACGDLFADGQACSDDFDCASRQCNNDVCESREVCQVP